MKKYTKTFDKKFSIMPKEIPEGYIKCETCGGTGWLLEDDKFLVNCPDCYGGKIKACKYCGKPAHKMYNGVCKDCQGIYENDLEKSRLEKAEIVEYDSEKSKSQEMYFSEIYPYNEGYFFDIEEFFDAIELEEIEERPKYIWGTTRIDLKINAYDIVESACEDLHEDAFSNVTDIDELQKFLDKWCNKQSGVESYCMDYKLAIRIPWEEH